MKKLRNWGKEIKDLGVLIIVIGIVMLALVLYIFVADGNNKSALYEIVENHFVFLCVGGLVMILVGIITRSVGKSKELKFNSKNENQE